MEKKLIEKIMEIAEDYTWLVVDDYYTKGGLIEKVWGSNADRKILLSGGGKAAIIDTEQILQDEIELDLDSPIYNGSDCIDVEELAEQIIEYQLGPTINELGE